MGWNKDKSTAAHVGCGYIDFPVSILAGEHRTRDDEYDTFDTVS